MNSLVDFRFGCCTCLVEGSYHHELRKMTFPIARSFQLRSEHEHRKHQRRGTLHTPVFGVKGFSPLEKVLRLPVCIPYDAMHLLHLGIAKKLLQIVVDKRLVDMPSLSQSVTEIKVPHSFRRRPRNICNELAMWKAQEHKVFLLYFAPKSFYLPLLSGGTDITRQLFCLYMCLASSIYALSEERIKEETLESVSVIIYTFQKLMNDMFGPGVRTGTLHSLIHLPRQVENFGSISATTANCFENVNRFLKRSVTGKVRQGRQIAERFLFMQKCTVTNSCVSLQQRSIPRTQAHDELLSRLGLPLDNLMFLSKISVNDRVFHSYDYGRHLHCASYFAYASGELLFVKIKHIIKIREVVKCICRTYDKVSNWHDFMFPDLTERLNQHFSRIRSHFQLRKSCIKIFEAEKLSHHAIISKLHGDMFYGVKVLKDFGHE